MSCLESPMSKCTYAAPSVLSDPSRWYAVYTYPRHEKAVTGQLESKAVETFLPTYVTESRWRDRRVKIQTPVFPGYVFTRIAWSERSKVLAVAGVVRMLSFNGTAAPIDDSEIEAVRLCLRSRAMLEPLPFIEVGERVRVRSGMLAGLEGLVTRRKNDRRLVVPITLINQSVAVEIDVSLLERLVSTSAADLDRWNLSRFGFGSQA